MNVLAKILPLATLLATATATSKQIAEFRHINLSPNNEKSPFVGFPNASGIASIQLHYDPAAATGKKRKICIQTRVVGFSPEMLKIYKAKMTRNGVTPYVDFSNLLRSDRPTFSGCRFVNQPTFHDIRYNPELFYVNAYVASSPTSVSDRGVRGQLVQRLFTNVTTDENNVQFEMPGFKASGVTTIWFENAGTKMCINATIKGYDLLLAHFHLGEPGENGVLVADLSSLRVAARRYLGCGSFASLGITNSQLADNVLANPSKYYIQFHVDDVESGLFNYAIRGQFGD